MATKETLERKRALETELEKIQAELKETNGEIVRESLAEFFAKYPQVEAVRWTQYTPYFNDGDACEFSSGHCSYPYVRMHSEGDENHFIEVYMPYDFEKYSEEEKSKHAWKQELIDALEQFTDNDMLAMFGDHAQVTITRDKLEVEEYDHD